MAIELYKANDLDINFSVKDQDDNSVDLSDAEVQFVVKEEKGKGEKVIEKSSEVGGEITIDEEETSTCTINFEPEDTKDLVPKSYEYELLIKLPATEGTGWDRYTAEVGEFVIEDTVIEYED